MKTAFLAATTLPDPDTIRRTAQEVVKRTEFQIRPTHDDQPLWEMLWRILRPIFKLFSGLWDVSPLLAWTVFIGLSILCIVLIAHIAYTIRQAVVRRTALGGSLGLESRKTDPIELERKSEDAAAGQDYITAVRLLFRAALLRIAQREKRELRPGTTNREYAQRYRQAVFSAELRQFVDVLDAKWYGHGVCDSNDYQTCRRAHRMICETSEVMHAHGA